MENKENRFKVVISGSFRKHFEGIQEKIEEFEKAGIVVLSPKKAKVVNPTEEFAILETDKTTDPKTLEQQHLDAIYEADVLYLYNEKGYIGASATMELGWALALGKPIYAKEEGEDFTLKLYCGKIATPKEIKKDLVQRECCLVDTICYRSPLAHLQEYIHKGVVQRGFDKETPRDIMLLMVEEVGELAKALRKYSGLKIDQDKKEKYTKVESELADVFIYLLDLANSCGINLFKAFQEKEQENVKRTWNK